VIYVLSRLLRFAMILDLRGAQNEAQCQPVNRRFLLRTQRIRDSALPTPPSQHPRSVTIQTAHYGSPSATPVCNRRSYGRAMTEEGQVRTIRARPSKQFGGTTGDRYKVISR
jgi:hypothetical protein